MTVPLRIGIAGLGNVGTAVFRLLTERAEELAALSGRPLIVTAVSARDMQRQRGEDFSQVVWHQDPQHLVNDDKVDMIIELIGGARGAAEAVVRAAILKGKPLVTANKALLAEHADLWKNPSACIGFEAAVCGGIPIIKNLREGLAANQIKALYGILNGTCNFILSEMSATGREFDDVLAEAKAKGYAEADPAFDIDGIDAAHKLSLLSALAFGCAPNPSAVTYRGIRNVSSIDIAYASELGYNVRLLATARETKEGILQSVEPCLIPRGHPMAAVKGVLNAVCVDTSHAGDLLFIGAGAGGAATASAVVADVIDIARGRLLPFGGRISTEKKMTKALEGRHGAYFLRLLVLDKPGVIAKVSAILRDEHVSLESVLQRGRDEEKPVSVILTTHPTTEAAMRAVISKISCLECSISPPHAMRIETFDSAPVQS